MKSYFIILICITLALHSCQQPEKQSLESGVSHELAQQRFNDISNVEYLLELTIPDSLKGDIEGKSTITLIKKNHKSPLILDFASSQEKIISVQANEKKIFFSIENEHLVIPASYLQKGINKIEINYKLDNGALNRNDNYFYSLFVPARARTAIPCFDQPDIKAKISYIINLPKELTAITNGELLSELELCEQRKKLTFSASKPISSYLWSFTVGDFQKITDERNGIKISLYHMEKDTASLVRNVKTVFDQVFHSIEWLEDYTEVDYPFKKYDLVCIPSFQFAGMEHPGAVYYRSELLFLSENPTQNQLLKRAQLLAHETAHMWFGDLVTMKWFSGVWQKEVFANFIADKIVEEQFPNINHQLTFLINHFPAAYSIDRTIGANPIQQQLDNLNDAGSMYGKIIYHKAPIVMNQLEKLTGKEVLKNGLSKYLKDYSYSNATWADLMSILNNFSEYDLELWSNTWVNKKGRPVIDFVVNNSEIQIKQRPEYEDSGKIWAQRFNYCQILDTLKYKNEVELLAPITKVINNTSQPDCILPSVDASGYGLFVMNDSSINYVINNIHLFDDNLMKGATLINLYENLLHSKIHPVEYIQMLKRLIAIENNEQILTLASNQLKFVFWHLTSSKIRIKITEGIEDLIYDRINNIESLSSKKMLFKTWSNIVVSNSGLKKLNQIIKKEKINKINLSERDLSMAVFNLCLKSNDFDKEYIVSFANKIKDEELRKKMFFVSNVFTDNETELDGFVSSLKQLQNRKKENWVLTAINYIHHPFKEEKSIKYLEEALAITETIKETGDIFFPIGWLNSSLSGYGSKEALQVVDYFFKDNPDFPEDLKLKVLQSRDIIERSSIIKEKYLQ